MKTRNVVRLLVLILLLSGCDLEPPWGHDDLTFEQEPYLGSEIRTDGYWYDSFVTPDGDTSYTAHFFYRNGVVRYGSAGPELDDIEADVIRQIQDGYDAPRFRWGLFDVTRNRIEFERWYPAEYVSAFIRSGQILSDTTFVITESRRSGGGEVRQINERYHFRAFSPKPDSTSRYIP